MTEDDIHPAWTDDELDEALNALRADELADQQPLVAARTALLKAVRATEAADTPVRGIGSVSALRGAPRRTTGRRWWLGAAAAAVVMAVGATAVVTGAGNPAPSTQMSPPSPAPAIRFASVQQALSTAADEIHVAGEEPIPAGKFRYTATRTWLLQSDSHVPVSFSGERLTQIWQPSTFGGQWLLKTAPTGNRKWFVGDEQQLQAYNDKVEGPGVNLADIYWPSGEWRAAGGRFPQSAMSQINRDDDEWSEPTERQLAELPRDPQKLYDLMAADPTVVIKPGLGGVLNIAAELLKTGTVPADLQESIYRAVAKIPGLRVTEQVANLDGRTGVALGLDPGDGSQRMEIIVDPTTGAFIGERFTQLTPWAGQGVAPGTVTSSSSVSTAIVSQMGDVPPVN